MSEGVTVRTSEEGWLGRITETYRAKENATLIDDAGLGIDPASQSIVSMGRKADLTAADWKRVAGCAGIGLFGVALIAAAILDPEPTSKLGLIVGTGAFCVFTGARGALHILTGLTPPTIEREGTTFRIRW